MQWVITKTSCDGIGNVMKGFLSAFSIYPNTKIECNSEYSLGQYDTVLAPNHIYTGGPREAFYTCRLLVLRSEQDDQESIETEFPHTSGCGNPRLNHNFSMTKLIDWNYDPERIHPRIRHRIISAIDRIQFQPQILERVRSYTSQFTGRTLGVSVRTWTASHERDVNRPYSFEVYMDAIQSQLKDVSLIVLSVDNPEVLPAYLTALSAIPVIVLTPTEVENPTQFAFIKMLTLAHCDVFIGNRISTFTELVFWFSRHKTRVITVF
jgi:hypothetical protein